MMLAHSRWPLLQDAGQGPRHATMHMDFDINEQSALVTDDTDSEFMGLTAGRSSFMSLTAGRSSFTRGRAESLNRRAIVGGLAFAALAGARDADAAVESFSPDEAAAMLLKGASCGTSNCAKKILKEVTPLLDTAGVPIISLDPPPQITNKALYGLKKDVSVKSKAVISTDQRPDIMWLVDKATGEVLVAKSKFDEAPHVCTGIFSGKVGLPVEAKIYTKGVGLWVSETFELVRPT
jgi:hypothetical protein